MIKLTSDVRKQYQEDILAYLGNEILNVELTRKMLNVAIDMGYADYCSNTTKNLFELCLAHAMIMLGLVRSKFGSFPIPGATLDFTFNATELLTTGRELIAKNRV